MSPSDLELIKKMIEEGSQGIDLSIVAVVVSGLVAAIAALWGWGFKLSKDFAAKIEEILKAQQVREDQRDQAQDSKLAVILETKEARHQQEIARSNTRIDRLEQALGFSRDQYNANLKEGQALLTQQLAESTASLQEHCEITEVLISLIRKMKE
jgi:hypothetical protein